MHQLLLLLILLSYPICSLGSLNLSYYSIIPAATNNSFNVSAFNACVCACLSCFDCRYFSYWSSSLSPTCELYTLTDGTPPIAEYQTTNNDTVTGVYLRSSSSAICATSITSSLFNYFSGFSLNITRSGIRIVSVLIMSIASNSQLLTIDGNNDTFYIFDTDTFQMVANGTFSSTACHALCAYQSDNLIYIGCSVTPIIQVYQFVFNGTSNREVPILMYTYSTAGSAQGLAVLNSNTVYYVTDAGNIYVLLTQTNTSILLDTISGSIFNSPSIMLALDSVNMALFLAGSNGTLYRLQLSTNATNNGTALAGGSAAQDQYSIILSQRTSIFLDGCNRLWVYLTGSFQSQMIVFDQGTNPNISFATMTMINITNSLPSNLESVYNFILDANYSIFTSSVEQGAYGAIRKQTC